VELTDLAEAAMGPVDTDVVLRPGDLLFLRSFTPHRVETLSPCSLHMSFDLCDRQPSIERALQLLLQHYDRESSPRLVAPREDLAKLFDLARTPAFDADLAHALAAEKSGQAEFRRLLSRNRITHLDRFIDDRASKVRT
jgi:hypothetical protein